MPSYYPHSNLTIIKPPYMSSIPTKETSKGTLIIIHGRIIQGADKFDVNLMIDSSERSDIAFHFNPRLNGKIIVLNNRKNMKWEDEERITDGVFPFKSGKEFEMVILMAENGYKVAVNGKHLVCFKYRVPLESVRKIAIGGDVVVASLQFDREFYGPQYHDYKPSNKLSSVVAAKTILNPPIPYYLNFPDGLHSGMMIYVSARPNLSAHKFAFNFMRVNNWGDNNHNQDMSCPQEDTRDIAFHFNVRHSQRTIVRNSRIGASEWQDEERIIPFFPFTPGVNFDMIFGVNQHYYMIAINGQHFLHFKHRIEPIESVNLLEIIGDIDISSIRYF